MKFLFKGIGKNADSYPRFQNPRGSVLIICFFVLVLLTMFAITVGYTVRQKFQVLSRLDARQKLRLIGDSGVQKSVYVLLKYRERGPSYDALNQVWSCSETEFKNVEVGEGSFSVFNPRERSGEKNSSMGDDKRYGLIDEERKIPVHFAFKSPAVLRTFFKETAGMSEDDAAGLVDAIRDWEDEDDDVSLAGAESRYYKDGTPSYKPRNGKLAALPELQWVKGMTPEIYTKILPYVTLDSSGLINLNTAPRAVLAALGISPVLCDKIVSYRNGRDRKEGTPDDRAFDDLSAISQLLANESYLNDNERADLDAVVQSGVLTVQSRFFTAQVLVQLKYKTQSLRITAVFNDEGVIKRWEEVFVVS